MNTEEIVAACNARCPDTLMETLGIIYTDAGENWLQGEMTVTQGHLQPMGLLHGGATLALAETLGSAASHVFMKDPVGYAAVGLSIQANHIKSAHLGDRVIATAKMLHKGRRTHVVEIRITLAGGELVSFVTMTNATIQRPSA